MNNILLRTVALLTLASVFSIPAQSPKSQPAQPSPAALLDINTATQDQLLALPGMGRVYVQRIIEGRPYTAKNQLLKRGILPEGAYEKIADQIVAKKVPRP